MFPFLIATHNCKPTTKAARWNISIPVYRFAPLLFCLTTNIINKRSLKLISTLKSDKCIQTLCDDVGKCYSALALYVAETINVLIDPESIKHCKLPLLLLFGFSICLLLFLLCLSLSKLCSLCLCLCVCASRARAFIERFVDERLPEIVCSLLLVALVVALVVVVVLSLLLEAKE